MTATSSLSASLAKTLIKNYTDNHLEVINSSEELTALRQPGATSDSRCCWFSVADLQNFINQVQTATEEKCSSVTSALGVRFYFCEYPAAGSPSWGTPDLPMTEAKYAGMHTLMLVPTYNDGSKDVDFDPNYSTGGVPTPLTAVFANISPSASVLMMNHGGLIPPPNLTLSGPTTGAYMLDIANAPANP